MSLRSWTAVNSAKITNKLINILNVGSGVTLPGLIASKIDPNILSKLSCQVKDDIIVVLGTNGKTTTNSIIYNFLDKTGVDSIINKTGANMLNGITSAFVLNSHKGKVNHEFATIEVDEFAAKSVLKKLNPSVILLTNIARDQLDRFGEVDITINAVKSAIEQCPDACVVVNCDDVISYSLSQTLKNKVITYGINEQIFDSVSKSEIRESIFCRNCGKKLEYKFFHYGQLGLYKCPNCSFSRPEPDFYACNIEEDSIGFSFNIKSKNSNLHIKTKAKTPYNIFNTLSAYTALYTSLNKSNKDINAFNKTFVQVLRSFNFGNNREDIFNIKNCTVQLHLAKNPMGFQQKISLINRDNKPKDIIILINDNPQDGTDISWLWDVDFQYLNNANVKALVCSGLRRYDMGLRLKYDSIGCKFTTKLKKCIDNLSKNGTGNLYIIVNYTALYSTNRLLCELSEKDSSNNTSNSGECGTEVINAPHNEFGIENYTSQIPKKMAFQNKNVDNPSLKITHLYPDLLNLYGDRGNIQTLRHRLLWRGIGVDVNKIEVEDSFKLDDCDICLLGGGSDREQKIVCEYLLKNKKEILKFINSGGVLLAVCGGYQLLGKFYKTQDEKIAGLDIIDTETNWDKPRLVGNIILDCKKSSPQLSRYVVGFENHGGRTYSSRNVKHFGCVKYGNGDLQNSKFEGVIKDNILATYLHGPLLPKNPQVCDYLLQQALDRKYGKNKIILKDLTLDDSLEDMAASVIIKRYVK